MKTFQMIDTAEVAKILGVSVGTVRNWRSSGDGPPSHKIEGSVRYEIGEVQTWAIRREEQQTPYFTADEWMAVTDDDVLSEAFPGDRDEDVPLPKLIERVALCSHPDWVQEPVYKDCASWMCADCRASVELVLAMPARYGWELPCGEVVEMHDHTDQGGPNVDAQFVKEKVLAWHYLEAEDGWHFMCTEPSMCTGAPTELHHCAFCADEDPSAARDRFYQGLPQAG